MRKKYINMFDREDEWFTCKQKKNNTTQEVHMDGSERKEHKSWGGEGVCGMDVWLRRARGDMVFCCVV